MKKICPFHRHDIVNITQWLNEYSSYGWAVKYWGSHLVEFEEYDGERYQYQLDMDNWKDGANAERKDQLEALGWEYVETVHNTRLHIYRSKDQKARMPVDEEFIKYNRKKLRFSPVYGAAVALLSLLGLFLIPLSQYPFYLIVLMQEDKWTMFFYLICFILVFGQFFDNYWGDYKLYRYLGEGGNTAGILEEQEFASRSFNIPLRFISGVLLMIPLVFLIFIYFLPEGPYVEGLFAERYYADVEKAHDEFADINGLYGQYWMNVSEKVDDQLFAQIVDRYSAYSDYRGHGFFRKEKYDTKDKWTLTEQEDERFDRLVIAQGVEGFRKNWLIFARMEDDIVYLNYRGEEISTVLKEIEKMNR